MTVAGVGAAMCVVAALALASPAPGGSGAASAPPRTGTPVSVTTVTTDPAPNAVTAPATAPVPPAADQSTPVEPIQTAPSASPVAEGPPLAGVPVEVRLPDTGAIPVVPIGVSADGVLDPPADIATAGWWVAGPRPGGPGRTLITGHIDSRAAGLGAFAALDALNPGDHVSVTTADGRVLDYLVSRRDEIEKTQLDPALLRGSDTSDLLLITCIGVFDEAARSYESNLLITAIPAPA
ncbi:MAG: class F sortase [Nakamurella sp.]